MTNIKLKNMTFAYPGQDNLFSDVTMTLDASWHLGLLGRNGRGKTTFLQIIQGHLPVQGQVQTDLLLEYFPYTIADPEQLTLYALQAVTDFEEWQLRRELNLMDCNPEIIWQPFATLSGGEQTKVLLAACFCHTKRFILLDEPTNHLDMATRHQIAAYLRRKKQGYIITSHDRAFLDEVVNHVLVIEAQNITLMQGNYSTYRQQKDRRDQFNQEKNDRIKQNIQRLRETARQKGQWASQAEGKKKKQAYDGRGDLDKGFLGAKAARIMKRATTMQRRITNEIEAQSGLLANIETVVPLTLNYQEPRAEQVLQARDLTVMTAENNALFKPVTFTLNRGHQLALVGANGSGKTRLVHQIVTALAVGRPTANLQFVSQLRYSYFQQLTQLPDQDLTTFAAAQGVARDTFFNLLRKLGFSREALTQKLQTLSAGQQRKVALALSLAQPANIYFWDEPFNYLDTYNQDQLVDLIKTVRPTMLLVEHDQRLLEQLQVPTIEIEKE
ncbi:ATP-binding cassette domain-containing protein [Ligilactobacillus saerimneri]|uniref:ATP-binding cassette domain-containing protein n=1 Tax=Ligilactobacillus saerimneri TaxID=228229 RepID=A0A7H9EIQ4_9LACO|nr:ATP-binding cassette domain-containing protein [Ligilactobacillus saerimneri]QLL77207.1 ATP-binding cassette domain-containing protein [Ligilactobacillus saerimneri]